MSEQSKRQERFNAVAEKVFLPSEINGLFDSFTRDRNGRWKAHRLNYHYGALWDRVVLPYDPNKLGRTTLLKEFEADKKKQPAYTGWLVPYTDLQKKQVSTYYMKAVDFLYSPEDREALKKDIPEQYHKAFDNHHDIMQLAVENARDYSAQLKDGTLVPYRDTAVIATRVPLDLNKAFSGKHDIPRKKKQPPVKRKLFGRKKNNDATFIA